MRTNELFTVPEGKNVTEQVFARVLVSLICSMLLCMACLAGTTWAWFTVSIENADNVIQVASNPEVTITINDGSSPNLVPGTHLVSVIHPGKLDDVQQKSTLYVTFSLDEAVQGYVLLNHDNGYAANINITTDRECTLSWTVSWFEPDRADQIADGIALTTEEETQQIEENAEPTDADPTKKTTQSTEDETNPTEETTQPAEAETDPT